MRFRALTAIILALFISGTAVGAGFTWYPATVNSIPQEQMRTLINAEHFRVCGRNLSHNPQLVWAARYKAQDMAYRHYFTHELNDGKLMWDFYDNVGIPWSDAGEILSWNANSDSTAAKVSFNFFMNSPAHRSIIQACRFTRFGVGVFKTRAGMKYFAVEFTKP